MHFIFWIITHLLIHQFNGTSISSDFSDRFKPAVQTGLLEDWTVSEASGLVASVNNKGYYWVVNDSGNSPELFLIDEKGNTVTSFMVSGCDNVDWEDMAMFTDAATRQSAILIGDIGDNYAVRDHVRLISIPEPDISENPDTVIEDATYYHFQYEDGARDAETLLVDPWSGTIYVITKREEQVRLYSAPNSWSAKDTATFSFQMSMPFRLITAGDVSPDGTELLLKTYNEIFYWRRKAAQSLEKVLTGNPELLQYTPEPQGESIAWTMDGSGFYTLSERSYAPNQALYFYERNTDR